MLDLFRALALAIAMLVAHLGGALPHSAPAAKTPPPPNPRESAAVEKASVRRLLAANPADPKPKAPAPQAALPATGGFRPVHYSGTIAQIIQQAFAPLGSAAVTWAERVAMCESTDNPDAHNSDGAAGLFQFMPTTWASSPYAADSVYDPVANARAAAWLYRRSGPGAWSCG